MCIVSSGGLHVNKGYDDDDEWITILKKGTGNAMRIVKGVGWIAFISNRKASIRGKYIEVVLVVVPKRDTFKLKKPKRNANDEKNCVAREFDVNHLVFSWLLCHRVIPVPELIKVGR